MAIYHQSDLAAAGRCLAQFGYARAGRPRKQTSALAYGVVMHYCMMMFETLRHTGTPLPEALQQALQAFVTYWNPLHIEAICEPVAPDGWMPRQSYGELRQRGIEALRKYADLVRYDDQELIGLEYSFLVPIDGTWDDVLGEPHLLAGSIDRLAIRHYSRLPAVEVGDFKALSLDTPLPTPTGWTTMGAVAVGDEVLGRDGKPCTVIAESQVYADRDCYRVTFDDGSSIVADAEHQWLVTYGQRNDREAVRTTLQLREHLVGVHGQKDQRIANAAPLELPDRELPVHPYVLGAWLGDGRAAGGSICKPDDELFRHIEACGPRIGPDISAADRVQERTVYGLRATLARHFLLGNKHVPDQYLRASVQQRLALLQGLMDTDGHWNTTRHRAVFTSTDKGLAQSVYELVVSLGWRAYSWEGDTQGFGKTVHAYHVWFTPVEHNPFRLSRKADRVDTLQPKTSLSRHVRRLVRSVEPTITVPVQCISVDSSDHLYLAGEQMVPTHNTGVDSPYLRQNLQFTAYSYATTKLEFWTGYRGEEGFGEERGQRMFERCKDMGRRGTWINLRQFKMQDAGWRGPIDYQRFALAVSQLHACIEGDAFPLTIVGSVCRYCEYRDICGGTGIAPEDHGRPDAFASRRAH